MNWIKLIESINISQFVVSVTCLLTSCPVPDNCTFEPPLIDFGKEKWVECHVRIQRKTRQIRTEQGVPVMGSNWVVEVAGSFMELPIYYAPYDETLGQALESVFLASCDLEHSLSYDVRREIYNNLRH